MLHAWWHYSSNAVARPVLVARILVLVSRQQHHPVIQQLCNTAARAHFLLPSYSAGALHASHVQYLYVRPALVESSIGVSHWATGR
jgi:arginine/lysine/ornithine decarboxylase